MLNLIYNMVYYKQVKEEIVKKEKEKENNFKKPDAYKNVNASQSK